MADPKYANLPGIAFDQPDVYESEDISSLHQDAFVNQDQSDSIEKLSTNIQDSYSKFQGHWLDSNKADFSGKIALKHHFGYRSWNGPYELQAIGEKEDLYQKINRLKCEVADLEDEIAKKKIISSTETNMASAEDLTVQVKMLHKQLLDMKIEEKTGGVPGPQLPDANRRAPKKCFSEVEEILKIATNAEKSSTSSANKTTSQIIYELQFNPHEMYLITASKAAQLINRLDRLERIFGASKQEKLDRLIAETGQKSLLDAVNSIHSKVSLLESSQLDLIEARLGVVNQKLNNIVDKGTALEEMEKLSKVNIIYETVKKLEPLMAALPSIVDRLLSLKKLHEEAVNFSESISQMENIQCQLEQSLATQTLLLTDMQAGLLVNMNTMKEAIKQIEDKQQLKK